MLQEAQKVQTSLRLPKNVYDQAKSVVEERIANVASFNDLVIAAITVYVKMARRRQIDLAFKGMAEDSDYQKQAKLIAAEFEDSDWEALELGEKYLEG